MSAASRLDEAIAIARHKLRVVWVHGLTDGACTCKRSDCKPGRHPVMKAWPRAATDDEQRLRDQYASLRIRPNLGIALGEQSDGRYLISIDVDDADRIAALEDEHGPLPETMMGWSPRGARRFYSLPGDTPFDRVKNVTGLGGEPGVDVKVEGGQVVVIGENDGGEYTGFDPTAPIVVLPVAWVLALLEPPKPLKEAREYTPSSLRDDTRAQKRFRAYFEKAVIGECRLVARTGEGQRNTAVYGAAFKLMSLAAGMHMHTEWAYIRREVESAGVAAGLSALECRRTIESAERGVVESGAVRTPREAAEPVTGVHSTSPPEPDSSNLPRLIQSHGKPVNIATNVVRMLSVYPGGGPRFDRFSNREVWPDGREVQDIDAVDVQGWLADQPITHQLQVSIDGVHQALTRYAHEHAFHPVQEYLCGLRWDGVRRLDRFAADYLRSPRADAFETAALRCFFIGAVARAMVPGCQMDTTLVLEGEQGARKTSALQALASAKWFRNSHINVHKAPDKYQVLEGAWIYELGEYDRYSPDRDQAALKSYLTERIDHYRPSYGRRTKSAPRSGVFAGTTNRSVYLGDDTGNRRILPVQCGDIDVDAIRRDRDQLWAEAKAAYDANEPWWLSSEMAGAHAEAAEERVSEDPWLVAIRQWAARQTGRYVTVSGALDAMGVTLDKRDRSHEMRAASCFKSLGYRKIRLSEDGKRTWAYTKVGTWPNLAND